MVKGGLSVTKRVEPANSLCGEISPPGDKSIAHRAVILNGIARGKARISSFPNAGDCLSTVNCMRSLGVQIESGEPGDLPITGVGIGQQIRFA